MQLNMLASRSKGTLLAGLFCVIAPSASALDMYLDINGIEGEASASGYEGTIDVLAWSWGASNGPKGADFCLQQISVTKWVDKASTALLVGIATESLYDTAKLTVTTNVGGASGGSEQEYLVLDLKNVSITSLSTGGSGGEQRLTENVTFNFEDIKIDYTSPDAVAGSSASSTSNYISRPKNCQR